jgi:hypothetical protein
MYVNLCLESNMNTTEKSSWIKACNRLNAGLKEKAK